MIGKERLLRIKSNRSNEEKVLWEVLRKLQINGIKFRRQQKFGYYVVDFVSFESKVIIELDGEYHKKQKQYDLERTRYLEKSGFKVIRFWNSQISKDIDGVVSIIIKETKASPPPVSSPVKGEEK